MEWYRHAIVTDLCPQFLPTFLSDPYEKCIKKYRRTQRMQVWAWKLLRQFVLWPWLNLLTLVWLSFQICKMGILYTRIGTEMEWKLNKTCITGVNNKNILMLFFFLSLSLILFHVITSHIPRLTSDSLCSWRWPRTSHPLISTSWVLGL